jgi:hypothetical protein
MDLSRLPFLPEELRIRVGTVNGYPVTSRVGESTVPDLYFAGAPSAFSIGPSVRFIAGTHNVAALLAKSLARGPRQAVPEKTSGFPARDTATV